MINPIIVSAPLKVTDLNTNDIENIYIFDYNKSFGQHTNKPQKLLSYIESLGCMSDLLIDNVQYKEKEELILEYFSSKTFYNLYSLTSSLISILFFTKGLEYNGRSIFTKNEIELFIDTNKQFVDKLIEFYDSLFIIMLLYSCNPTDDIKNIKSKFPLDRINKEELSPNVCNLLLNKEFYNYYDRHVNKSVYYYEFLFDRHLYKGKSFIHILRNEENTLLKLLIDMHNPKFKEYVIKKGSL